MSDALLKASASHRAKAMLLHDACKRVEALVKTGCTKDAAKAQVKREFTPRAAAEGLKVGLSANALGRHLDKWHRGGCTAAALLPGYGNQRRRRIPQELVDEFQRLMTMPGAKNVSVVVRSLQERWTLGHDLPGVGAWRDWWKANHPDLDLPNTPPEFPYSERSFYNHQPAPSLLALGQKGEAGFRQASHTIQRTREQLRPGELYYMDDKRPDLLCIDDATGEVTDVMLYVMMEGSSNRIVGYTLRPANAMLKTDVSTLIARVLETEGFATDYKTRIMMEHGTLTISDDEARLIDTVTGGHVEIVKPGMNAGKRTAMSAADRASGHWMAKVIESFMAKFDLYLQQLPGQRGRNYREQPANLLHSIRGKQATDTNGDQFRTTRVTGGEAGKAEALAKVDAAMDKRLNLETGMLWVSQFNAVVAEVVRRHNEDPDHNYEGFGTVTQAQTAPGVWEDVIA